MRTINDLPNAGDLAQGIYAAQSLIDQNEISQIIAAIKSAALSLRTSVEVKSVSHVNQILLEKKGYKVRNKSTGMNEYAIEISWV